MTNKTITRDRVQGHKENPEILQRRYQALFDSYDVGSDRIAWIKQTIRNSSLAYNLPLRPDASLFLLVNLDYIVSRPLSGSIPALPGSSEFLPEPATQNELMTPLHETVNLILRELVENAVETPVSAHQVMLAIDKHWDRIGKMLLWAT